MNPNQLNGKVQVVGSGYARGPIWEARTVREADDSSEFKEGSILVALDGDYDFNFAINRAAAVLVEQNDIESQVVKLCREKNVPCIVGIAGLLDWVDRFDYLEIDSYRGIIKKFKPSLFSSSSTYRKKEVQTKKRSLLDALLGR